MATQKEFKRAIRTASAFALFKGFSNLLSFNNAKKEDIAKSKKIFKAVINK